MFVVFSQNSSHCDRFLAICGGSQVWIGCEYFYDIISVMEVLSSHTAEQDFFMEILLLPIHLDCICIRLYCICIR